MTEEKIENIKEIDKSKEIEKTGIKNLRDSIMCASEVLSHIDESAKDCEIYYKEDKESGKNKEKTDKTDLILKFGILGLCSVGFGKILCDAFDKCKNKEKLLKRKLKEEEMKEIMEMVLKDHNVFHLDETNSEQYKRLSLVVKGIRELIQEEEKDKKEKESIIITHNLYG